MTARDLLDADIYLDTAFVVNAVFRHGDRSEVCIAATETLKDTGATVYSSEVLRIEYVQAIRKMATNRLLPVEIMRRFQIDRWQNETVRRRWITYAVEGLEGYLAEFPEFIELPLNRPLLADSIELMITHSLGSLDAVHLATTLHYEIPVFWTCDDHFRRVTEVDVEIIR